MSEQTPKRRFFSSTSLERAVLEAAGHFGLQPEELAYTKLEKTGVGARGKVSIKVDPSNPRKADEASEGASRNDDPSQAADSAAETAPVAAAAPSERHDGGADGTADEAGEAPAEDAEAAAGSEAPEPESEPEPEDEAAAPATEESDTGEIDAPAEAEIAASEEPSVVSDEMSDLPRTSAEARRSWSQADGPVEQAARKWTESLLRVASLDLDVEIYEREGELDIHLGGADAEVAVEDGGEVLRAMQHLLPRLMLGTTGNSVHCRVDCNDFRELHEERLRAQALKAASEATSDRGEVTLDPMHPADRRIVHLALADNELVRTESLGRGFFKRVSIRGN